ncbi:MAG: hypothetical protein LBU16_08720 [Treponema sp.]|jgi:hypothetical protein|nr:hypothetical protein [Treponema sp.]
MKKIVCLILLSGILSSSFAEDMAPLEMPSTRSLGMGGTHVAYTDDVYALFVNPAALQKANQGSGFELSPAFVGPFFDLIGLAASSGDDLMESLGDFTGKTGGKIPIVVDERGPLSVGYAANGLGWGIWNRIHAGATVIGTDIDASALVDLIANFGMSFRILRLENHEVDAGFVVKPFLRAKADMDMAALDMIGGGLGDMLDEFNVPLILGAGFDLGFMYRFYDDLAVGLTIDDVYTGGGRIATVYGNDDGVSSYRIPTTLNMGVAYTLQPIPWLGLAFMLDYRDVTNLFFIDDYTKRNPILNLAFGTELSIYQFLKLRFGLNEMLPAVGLGLVAKAFQFNVAIYGRELDNEPGGFSAYGLDLSISVRPETEKREWPWSPPILNLILGKEAPPEDTSAEAEAAAAGALGRLDAARGRP